MKRIACGLMIAISLSLVACSNNDEAIEKAYQSGFNDGHESGYQEGYEIGYDEGYDVGHADLKAFFRKQSLLKERPVTGAILSGKSSGKSEITVKASLTDDYVVMIKDTNGNEVVAFYVRASEEATIKVPAKYLDVYFACGTDWYGYGEGLMFGSDTFYSKDDETMDFTKQTWEYTMYTTNNGNFSETPSSADEFF